MPRFFKGVGGVAATAFNPYSVGFRAWQAGLAVSPVMMVRHILKMTRVSPFVSLTKSYEIAHDYAVVAAAAATPPQTVAYVYELNLSDKDVEIFDPILEIVKEYSLLTMPSTYHHDGGTDFVKGLVSDDISIIGKSKKLPGNVLGSPAVLTDELRAISYALRDAELLVKDSVPGRFIVAQHIV